MENFTNIDWSKKNINDIQDGVYNDMPIEVYHANQTHESSSTLKPAFESLAHYKSNKDKPKEYKSFFDFGNAFELSLTDINEFDNNVKIYDEKDRPNPSQTFRQKENKEWKENFYKENSDKLIIPSSGADSLDVLTILKASFYNHETAKTLVSNSEYQTSIFWTCPDTGLKLKTRPDFWKPSNDKRKFSIITDLKTDKDTEKSKHTKSICERGYPIQAIIQLKGLLHAGLIKSLDSSRFFWVFCCKTPPYNTEVYEFTQDDIQQFKEVVDFKLSELARAKKKGVFLSYNPNLFNGVKDVEIPLWYKKKLGIINEQ